MNEIRRFGPFEFNRRERTLRAGPELIRLGSRAIDLLAVLIDHAGEIVGKDALMSAVWPNTVVDEASVRVHVAAIRRALGDGVQGARYIVNVPGQGYSFVAAVERVPISAGVASASEVSREPEAHRLPVRLTRTIGRGRAVVAVIEQLQHSRLVTVVGPGGIGKTTLALDVAERVVQHDPDSVRFVDLAPVSGEAPVIAAVATAMGVSSTRGMSPEGLADELEANTDLIVLDNCEHVIEPVALLAVTLLRRAPRLRILATSREPLRVEGEWVYRLAPLESPQPSSVPLTAERALRFSAIQLLLERVRACADGWELSDADADTAAELCRRLDGIPLAIELAAVRVDFFGLRQLTSHLTGGLRLMTGGMRSALPRHQTLRATLEWSYRLLSDREQAVLRRLSVFAGWFTLEAAAAVASQNEIERDAVLDDVAELGKV